MSISFGKSVGFVAGGLGDQIYHLTQLRALAGASFDSKIDVACIHPGPISTLLANSPWAGTIIDARPLRRYIPFIRGTFAMRQIRQKSYNSAFVLHRSTSFKLAVFAAGIDRRVGLFGEKLDKLLLTDSLPADAGGDRRALWGHRPFIAAADAWIRAQGLPLDDRRPTILPAPEMVKQVADFLHLLPRPVTIINLFAVDPARRWSIDHANITLKKLVSQIGGSLVLNAGHDAGSYHDAMLAVWDGPDHVLIDSLRHTPSMARDIALYHAADNYVGVDSFTANLALNCNLPATVLFAKAADTLRYKPAVFPLYPEGDKDLNSIDPNQIVTSSISMLKSKLRPKYV